MLQPVVVFRAALRQLLYHLQPQIADRRNYFQQHVHLMERVKREVMLPEFLRKRKRIQL